MSQKPVYDLDIVQEIALDKRKCRISLRLLNWLDNHGYRKGIVHDIIHALKEECFCKTVELEKMPGKLADVYKLDYEDEKWYVKLFLDDETGQLIVRVWSCWPNGFLH